MRSTLVLTSVVFVYLTFSLTSCSVQDDKPAKPAEPAAPAKPAAPAPEAKVPEKAPEKTTEKAPEKEKAKAIKATGDVGLLDLEKNYMILVTKEGKLITLDFDSKTKVTEIQPTPAKIADVGLGSSAVVTYTKAGDKNVATGLEYKPAKGGD
jgi:hypothetical protein